jgi:ABC-2 type transport system permease protein
MRRALVIAGKDLRQRLRDRTALLVGVVAPLALAGLMGFALGGMEGGLHVRGADGASGAALLAHLERPWVAGVASLERAASAEEAAAWLGEDRTDAALVQDADGALVVLARPDAGYASRLGRGLAEGFAARAAGATLPSLEVRSPGGRVRALEFFGTSMAVLFLTFTVLSGSRALQSEAESGALARLAAAPVSPVSILAGKFGALVALGLAQMVVMIAATSLLFGARWGNPLPVAALVGTSVLMAVGLASFFVTAAGAERGNFLATVAIFLLAVIGGQFLPPAGLPDLFDLLNRLTPNGQAHRGFIDLVAAGPSGRLATVREPLLVTAAVGVAGISFSLARARTSLRRSIG